MKSNEINTKEIFFPEDTPRPVIDKTRKRNLKGDIWIECTRRKREREI
ncbi:hypothetical protein JW890_00035 [candidate division WOR-3 bacterium]|nr:hypothetical protein [candidate division WOR-3 bacterium]